MRLKRLILDLKSYAGDTGGSFSGVQACMNVRSSNDITIESFTCLSFKIAPLCILFMVRTALLCFSFLISARGVSFTFVLAIMVCVVRMICVIVVLRDGNVGSNTNES